MANIRVDSPVPVFDGQALSFKSPASCSNITGLRVYYPDGDTTASKVFQFADAHGNNVGGLDLFASNVVVKVILDTDSNLAFVQNADTNAYLEGRFASIESSMSASAKIVYGSYVGTGTYGEDNPTSITFDFAPKVVMLLGCGTTPYLGRTYGVDPYEAYEPIYNFVMTADLYTDNFGNPGFTYSGKTYTGCSNRGRVTNGGKTFEWYSVYDTSDGIRDSAAMQCNSKGATYYYLAIG